MSFARGPHAPVITISVAVAPSHPRTDFIPLPPFIVLTNSISLAPCLVRERQVQVELRIILGRALRVPEREPERMAVAPVLDEDRLEREDRRRHREVLGDRIG